MICTPLLSYAQDSRARLGRRSWRRLLSFAVCEALQIRASEFREAATFLCPPALLRTQSPDLLAKFAFVLEKHSSLHGKLSCIETQSPPSKFGLWRTLLPRLLLLNKGTKIAAQHFAAGRDGHAIDDAYASAKLLRRGSAFLDVRD